MSTNSLIESFVNHPVVKNMDRHYIIEPESVLIFVRENYPPYGFGKNCNYQLGLGHNNDVFVFPESIPELQNSLEIVSIVNAGKHLSALTSSGRVLVWGSDLKNCVLHKTPTYLTCPETVIKVACSYWCRLILQSNGQALLFNLYDQQCLDFPIYDALDIGCTSERYLILTNEAIITDKIITNNMMVKTNFYSIDSQLKIKQLICGKTKILFLTADGFVYQCDFNDSSYITIQPLNIDTKIVHGHGFIQHNTFVLEDCHQRNIVWKGDSKEIFFTNLVKIADILAQFESEFTSLMIT